MARKIISCALLEIEHPQKPDDEQRGGGNAVHRIGGEQPPRGRCRQLLADQDDLHGDSGNKRERRQVMEEGEQCRHGCGFLCRSM